MGDRFLAPLEMTEGGIGIQNDTYCLVIPNTVRNLGVALNWISLPMKNIGIEMTEGKVGIEMTKGESGSGG